MLNTKCYMYLLLLISTNILEAAPQCEHWIAKLLSAQGTVEKQGRNQADWQPVNQVEFFCQGDKVRTLNQSKVILKFIDEPRTIIELKQNSAITFPKIDPDPNLPLIERIDRALFLTQAIQSLKLAVISLKDIYLTGNITHVLL